MKHCKTCHPASSRRDFLKFSLGTSAGIAAAPLAAMGQGSTVTKPLKEKDGKGAASGGKPHKSCIFLYMGGGPSHIDTWDPKPGKKTGGEFKALPTAAPGISISEHLPTCAAQMKNISLVRSVCSPEGAHERANDLLHIGTRPIPGLQFPSMGTVMSFELGDKEFPLPHFIAIDPPLIPQSTVFGEDYLPFRIAGADNPIPNRKSNVGEQQDKERAALLLEQNKDWDAKRMGREVKKVESAYVKSEDIMNTPLFNAFNYRSEPEDLKRAYGGRFGVNCLLARRLVQAGVSFVEIGMGGWDTHSDNFNAVKGRSKDLDPGLGTLIRDLAEKDMLKDTLVVWMGDFGRTPDINPGKGRDHWPKCFTVVLAGGGIQGGRVHGNSGPEGYEAGKDQVHIQHLFATMYKALGISPDKSYTTEGRKVKYAYGVPMGVPIKELF